MAADMTGSCPATAWERRRGSDLNAHHEVASMGARTAQFSKTAPRHPQDLSERARIASKATWKYSPLPRECQARPVPEDG